MATKKPPETIQPKKKDVKFVSVDEQNPASTNVRKLRDSLARRKEVKKKKKR